MDSRHKISTFVWTKLKTLVFQETLCPQCEMCFHTSSIELNSTADESHCINSPTDFTWSEIWTQTQKPCSLLTEWKGESRQVDVSVTVQRETLMCGTDKTLVCSTPARPTHPSRVSLGCERDVNWTVPMFYESVKERKRGCDGQGIHTYLRISTGREASRGMLSTRVKTTNEILMPLEYFWRKK